MIGLGYLVISITFGIKGVVMFFFGYGHISADMLWYSAVSILLSIGRKYIGGPAGA